MSESGRRGRHSLKVKTYAVEWFVRVGNASVKGSESVGFAFELLAAQAGFHIVC